MWAAKFLSAALLVSAAARAELVQFQSGGKCLVAVSAAERGALALGDCNAGGGGLSWGLNSWDDSPDLLQHPQLALAASAGKLCVNDDSVKCVPGTIIHLHACQLNDRAHVHTGNWFAFDAESRQITTSDFCPGMCLGVAAAKGPGGGTVHLSKCSDAAEALAWARAPTPPTPPPIPILPTPAPTPPTPPPTPAAPGARPNIVFFLTDDQDQLLGGAFPPTAPGGATPMPRTKALLADGGVTATNFYIHTVRALPLLLCPRRPFRARAQRPPPPHTHQ